MVSDDLFNRPDKLPAAHSQSTVFNCHPTSESSTVFSTPNIPDPYFNSQQTGSFFRNQILIPLEKPDASTAVFTFIFHPPATRNCSGTLTTIEYCYLLADRELFNDEHFLFNLSLLSPESGDGNEEDDEDDSDRVSVRVSQVFSIRSTPTTELCKRQPNNKAVCCDTMLLTNVQITSMDEYYGITISNSNAMPLVLNASVPSHSEFRVPVYRLQSSIQNNGDILHIISSVPPYESGVALLRFLIGEFHRS